MAESSVAQRDDGHSRDHCGLRKCQVSPLCCRLLCAHLAWAAFRAISLRCSGLIFSIRALAAFFDPKRANAAA